MRIFSVIFRNKRLWMLYALVMLWVMRNTVLLRQRDVSDYSSVDAMAMFQVLIVVAIFAVLLVSPLRAFLRSIKLSSLKYYYLFLGLGAVSALWSVNPAFSLYRAGEVIALSSAVLYFCMTAATLEETVQRVQVIVWPTLLFYILGTVRLTGFGSTLRNNGLGAAAAMVACFFVAWILAGRERKNRRRLLQAAGGTALVLVSMSLASWWSFWFGVFYCALFSRRKALIAGLVLAGVAVFLSLGAETRENLMKLDKTDEQIRTLHGRTNLWEVYMQASERKPLLGYGFATGARVIGRIGTNTHNGFYGALLGVGWVGVACWLMFLISLGMELLRYGHARYPAWLACAAALAAGSMNSMSISIFGEQWIPATTIFVAFLALHRDFLREARKAERQAPAQVRSRTLVPASAGGSVRR